MCERQVVECNKCTEKHNYFGRSKKAETMDQKKVQLLIKYLLTRFVKSFCVRIKARGCLLILYTNLDPCLFSCYYNGEHGWCWTAQAVLCLFLAALTEGSSLRRSVPGWETTRWTGFGLRSWASLARPADCFPQDDVIVHLFQRRGEGKLAGHVICSQENVLVCSISVGIFCDHKPSTLIFQSSTIEIYECFRWMFWST